MSAFVVSNDHINLITTAVDHYRTSGDLRVLVDDQSARFGKRDALDGLSLDDIGRLLLDENVTAVMTRYADTIDAEEAAQYASDIDTYRHQSLPVTTLGTTPFPLLVLAATRSYRYQACEDPNYEATTAAKIIDAVREAAINDLPGYGDAERVAWSFTLEKALSA